MFPLLGPEITKWLLTPRSRMDDRSVCEQPSSQLVHHSPDNQLGVTNEHYEHRAAMRESFVLNSHDNAIPVKPPRLILQTALTALRDGRISEAVEHFDKRFNFNDHALSLEVTDKLRLAEFFEKAHELFPDTALEVVSLTEGGDYAIAAWKLTATQTSSCGSSSYQFPVVVHGSTIVRVERARIVQWSDYYDHASFRRIGLASHFKEWIEC
jgi:SnoaL-like polyketide cyclase